MKSFVHGFSAACAKLSGDLSRAIPTIGIAEDRLPNFAAKQLIDRNAQRLAEDIPAGNLNGGHCGAVNMPPVERNTFHQALGQSIDISRVLADNKVLQLVNGGLRGANKAVERAFADAMQTLSV